jgi:CDP-6-deoxy-D-xylo-4-hexulose-3-dehydrase
MNKVDYAIQVLSEVKPSYIKDYENFIPGKDYVQYSGQYWDKDEMFSALETLIKGSWIVSGDRVVEFQNLFSKKYKVGHSHMVNSGSSANLVMIGAIKKKFNWEDNSEIIVSPVNFPTTIAPLVQNKLKPIFVDIELNTLNFNVDLIESKITSKTKAIIVSPVLGNPPDMDKLKRICEKHNLFLLGDNCDSLGTKVNNQLLTKYYYAWTTSFYPAHHLSTGEGGMISSDDSDLIKIARSISWWGRDCYCVGNDNTLVCGTCGKRFDTWLEEYDGILDHKYYFTHMGYNLKPLDLQGAIGIAQLKKMDQIDFLRRKHKQIIDSYLEKVNGIRTIKSLPQNDPSWFGVPVWCESQELKEFFVSYLEDNKIQTRNYFAGNILIHPGYRSLDDYKKYPNANKALSNVFFIGCSPLYNEKVLNYIGEVIEQFS